MRKTDLFFRSAGLEIESVGRRGFLASCDALVFLRALKDRVADIVFLDPPFNLGKDYGFASSLETGDAASYESYMRWLIVESVRLLKPGGALFLYHLPYWASKLSYELHQTLQFRHWIAVSMKGGFVRGKRLYPAHYALLYYSKGEPARFKRPRFPAKQCRVCKSFIKDYGGYKDIIRRKGINLSDFWDDLSPVRHKARKHRRANQLPIQVTDRVVKISGRKRGILVDPFVGSGTSAVSALKGEMCFVVNDMSRAAIRVCRNRLNVEDHSC